MDPILDLIQKGNIAGFTHEVPETVVMSVSRVFIFRDAGKVLKVYRRDSEYWNKHFSDLSKGDSRSRFIHEDFAANRAVNPGIYGELVCADIAGGVVVLGPDDGGSDELVIVMHYMDTRYSFADRLFHQEISPDDAASIGEQFANIKKILAPAGKRPNLTWYEFAREHVSDLKVWMDDLVYFLPAEVISELVQKLSRYIEDSKERFSLIRDDELVYTIDAHGENALWHDGKFELFDILLPMARWRWTPKEYDLFRVGADIFALAGKDAFDSYLRGAKKVYSGFDETDRDFYLLYSGALMVCILSALVSSKPEKEPMRRKYDTWFRERLQDF